MTPRPRAQASVLTPTCPLCHTPDETVTPDSLRAGAEWACTRCGQSWTAARLLAVSAYAEFAITQPSVTH